MNVADVTTSLHSTGRMCDAGNEVLYTKIGAVVVPAGVLSTHLRVEDALLKYPRKPGGLYTAYFDVGTERDKFCVLLVGVLDLL